MHTLIFIIITAVLFCSYASLIIAAKSAWYFYKKYHNKMDLGYFVFFAISSIVAPLSLIIGSYLGKI